MTPVPMIAHYRLTTKLGEGGMGAVWRATDTKLNRDVAIKILPDSFASNPDRLARFAREAQVLAQLNHPNIAAIYGVEERALVMELVEGDTLPTPLPLEQALDCARQIADALEAAHEKGIIHRDLKPANIKVTPDGRVKVLDFGLAKAMAGDVVAGNPANSPTLTMGSTVAGVILGTAAYMAPEQAKGKAVDKRADIWAYGVVIYEMLSGRPAYSGETVPETLAAVIKEPPDLSALPPETPASIRRLLHRCLEKDPRRRLRDIGDARLELDQSLDEPAGGIPIAPPPARRPAVLPWIAAAIFALATFALAFLHFREAPAEARLMRFSVPTPENAHWGAWIALSPDGRYLGFTAYSADNKNRIWIRALDSFDSRMLAGTEGVNTFFWSPDSRWVAFLTGGKLKKVEISGGPPELICSYLGTGLGGAWNAQDVIVFGGTSSSIMRVPAAGGDPVPVTALTPNRDVMHVYPNFLSDGDHFLYMHRTQDRVSGIFAGSLKAKASEQQAKPVQASALDVSFGYSPPRPGGGKLGHLLFLHEGTLMAQGFDEKALMVVGEPVRIAESIATNLSRAAFSVSPSGMLAYRAGSDDTETQYLWFDLQGRPAGPSVQLDQLRGELALSPDNLRLAHTLGHTPRQIALLDLARNIDTRLTFNPDGAVSPVWSADGNWIAFSSSVFGGGSIYVKDTANSAPERKILQSPTIKFTNDWSRDGRFIVFTQFNLTLGSPELWAIADPLKSGEHQPIALTDHHFRESMGSISPDSRWLAYVSDESGASEIYVRPFPPGDGRTGRTRVSSAGGVQPRWRRDGKEMFYIAGDGKLMAVEVKGSSGSTMFESGVPHALFATYVPGAPVTFSYDVAADGKRFLMAVPTSTTASTPITLVLNWESGLKK